MTAQQFHEGQDVEAYVPYSPISGDWRKAKIVSVDQHGGGYAQVQFPDGTRAVFAAEHIRAMETIDDIRLGHPGEVGADQ